jgi:hypothetical protein
MWHEEVLPPGWQRAADDLAARDVLDEFYLAGGTGLALQPGHRRSLDLDLFRQTDFDVERLHLRMHALEGVHVRQASAGTLHNELRAILVSFLHYPYPLLFPLLQFGILPLADARDIACMKARAIASRGSRRDFVDLYVTARAYGLRSILDWFQAKYAGATFSMVHVFKALTYFQDARQEPMQDLLAAMDWREVEAFFSREVPRLL